MATQTATLNEQHLGTDATRDDAMAVIAALNAAGGQQWAYGDGSDWRGLSPVEHADREYAITQAMARVERSRAAAALGSIRTPKKAAAARANGAKGGRPVRRGSVWAVPCGKDGAVQEGWVRVGEAASRSGAIRACREAGYSVIEAGGLAEWGHVPGRGDEVLPDGWTVTVRAR